jgi:hypothetical protein
MWLWPSLAAAALAPAGLPAGATMSDDGARGAAIAEDFVKRSATFRFDGMAESLRLEAARPLLACPGCYEYRLYFESRAPGYGDRGGLNLTPQRTPHRATVVLAGDRVVSGVLDGAWDMLNQMILDVE